MSIRNRLQDDLKQAMRDRDSARLSCIRMLLSKLQEKEVEQRATKGRDHELSDEDGLAVISGYAKQRRDSIESYRKAGRDDLVGPEQAELDLVIAYLPEQLSEGELRELIRQAIAESGAGSSKEIGNVMRHVMPKVKGLADGKLVNRLAAELLGASE